MRCTGAESVGDALQGRGKRGNRYLYKAGAIPVHHYTIFMIGRTPSSFGNDTVSPEDLIARESGSFGMPIAKTIWGTLDEKPGLANGQPRFL